MSLKSKPIVLIILDGFGITSPSSSNAISMAKTPYFDKMVRYSPTMLLEAASLNVGLPQGEVGNSEVGHMNIGSGVLIYQSLPRIDKSIEDGSFKNHEYLLKAAEKVKNNNSRFHIMGLLGNGGVHAHLRHLEAILDFCKEKDLKNVFLHLFLDGRDADKDSGKGFASQVIKYCNELKVGKIATLCGRKIAMDRNKDWKKTEAAYNLIVKGVAEKSYKDPLRAINESYKGQIFDEEFNPTVITGKDNQPLATISAEDAVIFFNFRADRARQLTGAFVLPDFNKFGRQFLGGLEFITMAEYEKGLPVKVLFSPIIVKNPLAKIISDSGLRQLHIAETEKYAHITFFINGMIEKKFSGEDRILIPSPAVSSYDQSPAMSSIEITDNVVKAIKDGKHDFIFINYANPDMVAHTGNLEASVRAVEFLDKCLARVVNATVNYGGAVFIVGDHGNAEELVKINTGKIDKEHSIYPVPFITVRKDWIGKPMQEINNGDLSLLAPTGLLSDVTPTILKTAGLPMAPEMTGTNLLEGIS
ncbi:2,3-bisphosphoglycerate-independent phosphoglycerate mutase [Candidatus Parcubacteria bacterium]|nr:2,3-bisphosphoglycerate-independent phosphoglycerate mutase [Candidatus Parcubacteria bacterium]